MTATEGLEAELSIDPFTVPVTGRHVPMPRAVVIVLPALGTPARYYAAFADALAARKIASFTPELPGTGESRPQPSRSADYAYRDLATRYLPDLVALARGRFAGVPLLLAGHSLGGQALVLAARHGHVQVEGLLTVAAGHIHHRHWRGLGALKVYAAAVAAATLSTLLGYFPGQHLGFGGPQAPTLMREWARTIRSGRLADVGGEPARSPGVPALAIGYEGDFMAPRRSVEELARLLGAEVLTLPAAGVRNAHSDWLRAPSSTAEAIDGWLGRTGLVPA